MTEPHPSLPPMTFLIDTREDYVCLKCGSALLKDDVIKETKLAEVNGIDDVVFIPVKACPKCGASERWFCHKAWGRYLDAMGITMRPQKLRYGDLCVEGFETGLIVERKGLDFIAACGSDRVRFDKEVIVAARDRLHICIIIEMPELAIWENKRGMQWWAIQRSIGTWMARDGVGVYPATSPRSAAEMAVAYLMTQVVDKLDQEQIERRKARQIAREEAKTDAFLKRATKDYQRTLKGTT